MPESTPRIHAPEFTGAIDWFNVPAPLTLRALRGKVVLLDFWTYGCVNCMHILPDLKRLEQKYGDALVVVGIHSAKFTNERKSDNIRRILVRYEIDHPVANDAAFAIWKAYGARAWPTQVLIDPEGYVVGTASGEGHADGFDRAIAAVLHVFEEQGKLDLTPLPLSPEREQMAASTLAFPGKVLADEASSRLFIADSNHNRILVASLDGRVTDVIGEGGVGRVDGAFDRAMFFRPQGLALDGDVLYIADTENHLVRAANLATRTGDDARRHGQAGGLGRNRRAGARNGAQLAVGPAVRRPAAVRRHGRHASDLGHRCRSANWRSRTRDRAARRAWTGSPTRRRSRSRRGSRSATARSSWPTASPTSSAPSRCRRRTTCARLRAAICSSSATRMAWAIRRAFSIRSASRDRGDRLYIADTYNHRIRLMNAGGSQGRHVQRRGSRASGRVARRGAFLRARRDFRHGAGPVRRRHEQSRRSAHRSRDAKRVDDIGLPVSRRPRRRTRP